MDTDFAELVSSLPERQTSRPDRHRWKPTKGSPCACVMCCKGCGNFLPISDFYKLSKNNGRRDILGVIRSSVCRHCARVKASLVPVELRIFRSAKARATRRNMEFSLKPADIVIPARCPVLDIPLMDMMGVGQGSMIARQNSPSLDRIDNSKGYIPSNVIIISLRANNIKSDASLAELNAMAAFYENYMANGYTPPRGRYQTSDYLTKVCAGARSRAKAKGLAFDIGAGDIIIPDLCPILGVRLQPREGMGHSGIGANAYSPSLDRIDNSKGYVKDNIMIISMRANNLKSNATFDELLKIARFFSGIASCS